MPDNKMKTNEENDFPTDERLSIGYYSSNGLSRSNSSQNINKLPVDDPASLLMQKRIDDLEIGFKQLDRITDDIDYDIETLETVTGKLRTSFGDVQEDIQALREEMLSLFDRLDVVEDDMKAKTRKKRLAVSNGLYSGRRSFLGSKQMLNRTSQSDLRGSSYALDRMSISAMSPAAMSPAAMSPAEMSPATMSPASMSPAVPRARSPEPGPKMTPEITPSYSPASSPPLSPARSVEDINGNDFSSEIGSDY